MAAVYKCSVPISSSPCVSRPLKNNTFQVRNCFINSSKIRQRSLICNATKLPSIVKEKSISSVASFPEVSKRAKKLTWVFLVSVKFVILQKILVLC